MISKYSQFMHMGVQLVLTVVRPMGADFDAAAERAVHREGVPVPPGLRCDRDLRGRALRLPHRPGAPEGQAPGARAAELVSIFPD